MPASASPGGEAPQELVSLWAGLRSRWALVSLATFLYWFSAHSLRPLVSLRLDALGATGVEIGWIVAAWPLFSVFVALPGGRAIDRLGLRRVLFASLVGMALTGLGYAAATSPLQIMVVQAVNGVVELGVWLALQALASHAGSGGFLSRQLSMFSLAWGAGVASGPVAGAAIYARLGFVPLGLMYAIGTALAFAILLLVPYRDPERDDHALRTRAMSDLASLAARPSVRAVMLSSFVAMWVISVKNSFYTLYLEQSGVPVGRIGLLLTVAGLASLSIRLPLPRLLARFGTGPVLVAGMWVAILSVALVPALGSFPALLVGAACMGAGYGSNPPVTVEMLARGTAPGERGLAMGLRAVFNRSSQVIQPVAFGALIGVAGMAASFPLSGVLLAAMGAWASRQVTRHPVGKVTADRSAGR